MSCALEIPEANVGRFRLCFICFVSFYFFVLLEDQQKLSVGEFDRSIFMRLNWLVLVCLRCVSLVILVFKAIFICLQVLITTLARKVHFGACWINIGLKWIACMRMDVLGICVCKCVCVIARINNDNSYTCKEAHMQSERL